MKIASFKDYKQTNMNYIPRTLTYCDNNLNQIAITDEELLTLNRSIVILAEPGMGKTELLKHLEAFDNTIKFTASSFVRKPLKLLQDGKDKIVLIDALDEYQGKSDSNSIDDILDKLFELNNPKFILSCRQVEWESSSIENIEDFYGSKPIVTHIQPFSRKDAIAFLEAHNQLLADANQIIERLDEVNLSNFYENPLTLELLTHINTDTLPENKAEVLNLATQNLWQEVNDQAPNHLKETGSQSVLDCAGFIFATLLLAQKQVIFIGNTAKTPDYSLNIYELKVRYNEELLLDTLKCRLFKATDDIETFKPMHRTIAEFLGAKWLAGLMTDPIIKTRVLAQFIQNGGVVSSLRGLFSWLPYFNLNLTQTVIETDPYALIAYADTSFFTDSHSKLMYDALKELVKINPHFRRDNWNWLQAKGLTNRCLLEDYRQLLGDKSSDYNLRSSIIQILQDADFVNELSQELTTIMLENDYYYSERYDACLLLLEKKTDINWSSISEKLTNSTVEDDLRLVCECVLREDNYHLISDEQLVRLILNSQPLNKKTPYKSGLVPNIGSYYYFETLPSVRAENILNLLIVAIKDLKISPYEANHEESKNINGLVFLLLKKYLTVNDSIDSHLIAKSLDLFYHNESDLLNQDFQDYRDFFTSYFAKNSTLKISIQKLLLKSDDLHNRFYQLKDSVLSTLYPSLSDTLCLIKYVQGLDNSEQNKNIWKDLLLLNRSPTRFPVETLRHIEDFISDKPELLSFVKKHNQPRQKSLRELGRERNSRKELLGKKLNQQKNRTELRKDLNKLEAGDFHTCFYPANILLKHYNDSPKEFTSYENLASILREDLAYSARKGFENSLFSSLPDPIDFVLNEHKDKEAVLYAGIYCRYLDNKPLNDLSDNVILICSIIIEIASYRSFDSNAQEQISELIKKEIIKRGLKDKLVDTLLIPQFENNWQYIRGSNWLTKIEVTNTDVDKIVNILENQNLDWHNRRTLLEALVNHDSLIKLKPLICRKVSSIELLNENDDVRDASLWLALYSYIDQTDFLTKAKCFSYNRELFWQLRELYQKTSRSKKVTCSDYIKEWIIYRYHSIFPNVARPIGTSWGDLNSWDASEFINGLLIDLSNIPNMEAYQTLKSFKTAIHPSYHTHVINLLAQQKNKIREHNYVPPTLTDLLNIYQNQAPQNCRDLKTLVITLLDEIQKEIVGNDTDTYKRFYKEIPKTGLRTPHNENDCRDILADFLKPRLQSYGFSLETERDMPDDKRADLVCTNSGLQLPIEVKGQWHKDIWAAMNDQLGDLYLKEYQSEGQGIYLIFWFGSNSTKPLNAKAYRNCLKKPDNSEIPKTAQALKSMLDSCIVDKYKAGIEVYVIDVSHD